MQSNTQNKVTPEAKNKIETIIVESMMARGMTEEEAFAYLSKVKEPPLPPEEEKEDNNKFTEEELLEELDRKSKYLSGKIIKVFHSSDKFSAGIIEYKDDMFASNSCFYGDTVTGKFAGKVSVSVGEQVKFEGEWKQVPKWGRQFIVTGIVHETVLDEAGLSHYLNTNPAFKGIGPTKAGKIAFYCGKDFDRILREEPEKLKKVAGLSDNDIAILIMEWDSRKEFNSLSTWLASYELTHNQITKLIERFGHNLKPILQDDPYILCREVDGFGFVKTDQIALKMGIKKTHPMRIQAALVHVATLRADNGGHCWTESRELVKQASELLAIDNLDSDMSIETELTCLIGTTVLAGHCVNDNILVALRLIYDREMELIDIFFNCENNCSIPIEDTESILEIVAPSLNLSQRNAVEMVFSSKFCVITGSAGSGKSYTVGAIIKVLEEYNVSNTSPYSFAIAAPTGKAAKRIEELSGYEAKTIHRLLGYSNNGWFHNRKRPLTHDFIILDEFSMVDVNLAWRFFSALSPYTKVILVGDHNQLPPIGPGNILRDLLDRQLIPTTILEQVVRQAGILKENCTAILGGKVANTAPGVDGTLRPWYVFDRLEKDSTVLSALIDAIENKLPDLGVDIIKKMQVLTPTKKGKLGVLNLNIELQRIIQRVHFGNEIDIVSEGKKPPFYSGDKVMQMRNNYKLEIMNGTVGFVTSTWCENDQRGNKCNFISIDFGKEEETKIMKGSREYNDISLAYACTIHKYQGSEIQCALIIIHNSHYFMLHRNLLYTAVTRASKVAILLGNCKGIKSAATRQIVDDRKTFLSII